MGKRIWAHCFHRLIRRATTTMVVALVVACASTPFTGRKRLELFPEAELQAMAREEYDAFLAESTVVTRDTDWKQQVESVGKRLATSAQVYYDANGMGEELEGYAWEFNLVKSPEANAFCMPGGKVVIFTGILPIVQDADGLAIVMGHEIAHALARHGNERLSQQTLAAAGGAAVSAATMGRSREERMAFMAAYGAGATVGVLLPFSRKHESEADEIGLYLSTIAGFDPDTAAPLWQRMAGAGETPPEFLSTHPNPLDRARELEELVPRALELRKKYGPEVDRLVGRLQ